MGYRGRRGKDIELASGRKFIIAIVVVTTALSFTLGYFVGKAGLKERQQQAGEVPPKLEALSHPPQAEEQPQSSEQQAVNIPQIKDEKTPQSEKTTIIEKEASEPVAIKEERPVQDAIKYTIQAGAFKSLKEAETLKRKLESKGYKSHVKKSVSVKNERLFKVRTGDFATKEEAEIIALKLKKNGLNAFVTPKEDDTQREEKNLPSDTKKEKPR